MKSVHNNGSGEMIQYHVFGGTAIYTQLPTDTDPVLTENSIHSLGRIGVWKRQEDKKIYELKDHLGNVRVAFSRDPNTPSRTSQPNVIIERWADYYPFGGIMPGRSGGSEADYAYTYQGQRNAVGSDWHQFDLRMYSSDIGRFMSPDPYGQYYDKYLGMGNNPINGIDPDGGYFISREDGGKRWPGYWKVTQKAMPVAWWMGGAGDSWAMWGAARQRAYEMLPGYLREHRGYVDALTHELTMFIGGDGPQAEVQRITDDRNTVSEADISRINDAAIDYANAVEYAERTGNTKHAQREASLFTALALQYQGTRAGSYMGAIMIAINNIEESNDYHSRGPSNRAKSGHGVSNSSTNVNLHITPGGVNSGIQQFSFDVRHTRQTNSKPRISMRSSFPNVTTTTVRQVNSSDGGSWFSDVDWESGVGGEEVTFLGALSFANGIAGDLYDNAAAYGAKVGGVAGKALRKAPYIGFGVGVAVDGFRYSSGEINMQETLTSLSVGVIGLASTSGGLMFFLIDQTIGLDNAYGAFGRQNNAIMGIGAPCLYCTPKN